MDVVVVSLHEGRQFFRGKGGGWLRWLSWLGLALVWPGGCARLSASAAPALPEFAYRQLNLTVKDADGRPLAGASVYGYCHELNLWWPRLDEEFENRNDVVWHESYLGKTDANGSAKITVPAGQWGFFAAGPLGGLLGGGVIAVWSDFHERVSGEKIVLAPTATKHWELHSPAGAALAPTRVFLKPDGFPIWIPVGIDAKTGPYKVEMSAGQFQLWAAGDATGGRQGFALSFGIVGDKTPDGLVRCAGNVAVISCKGGQGKAALDWSVRGSFGLEGELALDDGAKVLATSGDYTLTYRRPVADKFMGKFVGEFYSLTEDHPLALNFNTPLAGGIDAELDGASTKTPNDLVARLYLVDGNGHPLEGLYDFTGQLVHFEASVTIGGKRFALSEIPYSKVRQDGVDAGPTMFTANVGNLSLDASAVWQFKMPTGVLENTTIKAGERVLVKSQTFQVEVPKVLEAHAKNVLAQAELLARFMDGISGRKRQLAVTTINVHPGKSGASATHNGKSINFGTGLFMLDDIAVEHTFVHELGHNYGLTHGGLHETIIEVSRSAGGEQISQQLLKWSFMDVMNGLPPRKLTASISGLYKYPNIGLYLYCYAQGGPAFLLFMSAHEYPAIKALGEKGYTADEVAAALLGLALKRDMTTICRQYGLKVTADRVEAATAAARKFIGTI